ncbi:MAG: hypothetical protein WAK55_14830, partial [Xanthobacteraceae bacterium]
LRVIQLGVHYKGETKMLARKIIMVLALLATATTLATTGAFAAAGNHSGYSTYAQTTDPDPFGLNGWFDR